MYLFSIKSLQKECIITRNRWGGGGSLGLKIGQGFSKLFSPRKVDCQIFFVKIKHPYFKLKGSRVPTPSPAFRNVLLSKKFLTLVFHSFLYKIRNMRNTGLQFKIGLRVSKEEQRDVSKAKNVFYQRPFILLLLEIILTVLHLRHLLL